MLLWQFTSYWREAASGEPPPALHTHNEMCKTNRALLNRSVERLLQLKGLKIHLSSDATGWQRVSVTWASSCRQSLLCYLCLYSFIETVPSWVTWLPEWFEKTVFYRIMNRNTIWSVEQIIWTVIWLKSCDRNQNPVNTWSRCLSDMCAGVCSASITC